MGDQIILCGTHKMGTGEGEKESMRPFRVWFKTILNGENMLLTVHPLFSLKEGIEGSLNANPYLIIPLVVQPYIPPSGQKRAETAEISLFSKIRFCVKYNLIYQKKSELPQIFLIMC